MCLCALCLINTLSVYGKLLQNVYQNFNFSAESMTQIMRYLIKLYGLKKRNVVQPDIIYLFIVVNWQSASTDILLYNN